MLVYVSVLHSLAVRCRFRGVLVMRDRITSNGMRRMGAGEFGCEREGVELGREGEVVRVF